MAVRRIFAAIDVGDEVRSHVSAYSDQLRREFASLKVRWERPEKFHITLRFEAKADESMLTRMIELIDSAAASTAPFDLAITGTGAFVNRRGPGVLWIGAKAEKLPDGSDRLGILSGKLSDKDRHGRKFHPHLTIARLKDAGRARELIEKHKTLGFPEVSARVKEIVLFESRLETSGSTYTVLMRQPLTGAD